MSNWVNKQIIQVWGWGWWSSNLTEYTVDPVSPSSGQQWLLKWAIPTLRTGITMLWVIWLLAHRKDAVFLKIKTSLGVKSILTQ